MSEFYGPIRQAHIAAVLASGSLFLLRAALAQVGRERWALAPPPRYLSYAIDTTLLTAAVLLLAILPPAAYAGGWLAAKLALLPVYIGFGWFAIRAQGRGLRLTFFAGAALAYGSMFSIARTHDPLGPLQGWFANV